MSKKTKIDPTMQTVFDLTDDKLRVGGPNYSDVCITLDDITTSALDSYCLLYGHDVETVINGILSVEINRLKGLKDEK